jgi:N utilization substance protein A
VKAVIYEVRKTGQRVKIVLSRSHEDFVRALFEEEIPEIADRTIDIRAISREPGYRSKLAVVSIDMKVDCVGACVGVRGSRIKNIIEELNGERIDIVRWNDSLQVLIPYALQPAQISDVFTYPRLGRAIVMVDEDQLSLAIGRRGQNVRLASKLVKLDLEIMTQDELGEALDRAERWFRQLPHVSEEHVQAMIGEGFLSYNELTFIDEKELAEFTGIPEEQGAEIIEYAEQYKDMMEKSAEEERRQAEEAAEAERRAAAEAEAQSTIPGDEPSETSPEAAEFANPKHAAVSSHEMPHAEDQIHDSMPTDAQAMEQALIDEELRTGEDGELTTPEPGEETGASA